MAPEPVATNLVLRGGPLHDFDASTAVLVELLAEEGIRSTVIDDPHAWCAALEAAPQPWDLVTVNALRWSMAADRYAPWRDEWACALDPAEIAAIDRHVRGGGGLLACHTAVICFDADPTWHACLGATWSWGRSSHPPHGPAHISVTDDGRGHPLTAGLDGFDTVDEIYGFLDLDPDVTALFAGHHGGTDHPVLWAREVGRGRVVVDLLGHDAAAMDHATHAELVRRAARWLTRREPTLAPERPT